MFGIGMPEMLLILAIALIVIGPKKLPDLAKSLGRALREFKKATSELKESMELDGELKDVKKSINSIGSDIKGSGAQKPGLKSQPAGDPKIDALEDAYGKWREGRSEDKPAGSQVAGDKPEDDDERLEKTDNG